MGPNRKPAKPWDEPGSTQAAERQPQVQICSLIRGAVFGCLGCALHKVPYPRGCCSHCEHLYHLKTFLNFYYSFIDVKGGLFAHQLCPFSVRWQERDPL